MAFSFSSNVASYNQSLNGSPTSAHPQGPSTSNGSGQRGSPPQMQTRDQQDLTENRTTFATTAPDDHHRRLLASLNQQISSLKPPLTNKLPDILALFEDIKQSEGDLADLLWSHGGHSSVTRLKSGLLTFAADLATALNSNDATTRVDGLRHADIQAICLGLSVCAPAYGARLFDASLDEADRATLQSVIDTLLTQAMSQGLPDGVEANGQVFDIVNLVSRYLKAGLVEVSPEIRQCFGKVFLLIEAWTGGDQCKRLLSDHNLGRCAVQVATLINYQLLDLKEVISTGFGNEQPKTQGQLLQQCVLHLCSDTVLSRLTTAPVDTVSLLNVCNTIKDALDKRVLHPANPSLLPALDRLTKAIGKLPQEAVAGPFANYVSLANFGNFLRSVGEYRSKKTQVFKDVLPSMEPACAHLIGIINADAFAQAEIGPQALSNLVSFVKYCDKLSAAKAKPAPEASDAAPTTTAASTAPVNSTATLSRSSLQDAASQLASALVESGIRYLDHPNSRGGVVTGLTYLWQRNLVPRTPELRRYMRHLLAEIAPVNGKEWPYDASVIMPALKMMLDSGMVDAKDLWLSAEELGSRISELGAIVETVVPLPPLPLPAVNATVIEPPKAYEPPGATRIGNPTIAATFGPASRASTYRAPPSDTWTNVDKGPKHLKPEDAVEYRVVEEREAKRTEDRKKAQKEKDHTEPKLAALSTVKQSGSEKTKGAVDQKKSASEEKQTANAKPGQQKTGGPTTRKSAAAKRAPDSGKSELFNAVNHGDLKQIDKLLQSAGSWTEENMRATLREFNDGLYLPEKTFAAGFERFVQEVLRVHSTNGLKWMIDYFTKNPPQSIVIRESLKKSALLIATQKFQTAGDLVNFASSVNESAWKNFINTKEAQLQLNKKDADGNSVLYLAVTGNSALALDRLLKIPTCQLMAVNRNKLGNHPLRYAIENNLPDVAIKLLALSNADEQAAMTNPEKQNALIIAAVKNQAKVMDKLLGLESAPKLLTDVDHFGGNALVYVISHRNFSIAERMLRDPSADMQASTQSISGLSPLMEALKIGAHDIAKLLLSLPTKNKQALLKSKSHINALMLAIENDVEIARILLQLESADMQARAVSKNGVNPLHYAIENGRHEIAEILLSLPSAPEQAAHELQNRENLLSSSMSWRQPKITELILQLPNADALVRATMKNIGNPLGVAIEKGYPDVALKMLKLASNIEQSLDNKNAQGMSPLMLAARNGFTEIVKRLLELSSAADQSLLRDKDGWNALMFAAFEGQGKIVEMLLQLSTEEAQCLSVDKDGYNALFIGASQRHEDVVAALIKSPSVTEQTEQATKAAKANGILGSEFINVISELGRSWIEKYRMQPPQS